MFSPNFKALWEMSSNPGILSPRIHQNTSHSFSAVIEDMRTRWIAPSFFL